MEVKYAVAAAKRYLSDLLDEEGLSNVGLEEIEYDETNGIWNVTLGFSRPWNTLKGPLSTIAGEAPARRAYRVLKVRDADGVVVAMKKRELVD